MRLSLLLLACSAVLASSPQGVAAQTLTRAAPIDRADQNPRTVRQRQTPGPRMVRPGRVRTEPVAPFLVRSVTVENSTLPAAELADAWRPFIGQTLDSRGLLRLTDALAAVYERHGVAIYTVTVPAQVFADGALRVRALEGYVEDVQVVGPAGARNRALIDAYLAKLTADRPLRKATLQRYISLIRDIPGMKSDMALENGAAENGVRLKLAIQPHPVQVAVAVNNRGTPYLGRTQIQADLYLNSLLRQGDQTRLTAAAPTDFRRFQSYSGSHSQPVGADGLTVTVFGGYLRTRPKDTPILGHSASAGVQASYPLIRGYDRDAYLTVSLDGVDSDNAFLGFTFANDRTRAARAALSYSRQTDRRLFYGSATLSAGVDGIGARTTDRGLSDLDFKKLNLRGGANFAVGKVFALRLTGAAQATRSRLPGTEQFAIGGEEFGRGYEASVIAGDYGYAGAAEVAFIPAKLPKAIGGSEAYAFVDGGKVWYRARFGAPTSRAHLTSGGAGVRVAMANRAIVQLEAAKAFDNPLPFLDQRGWRGVVSIRTLF